MLENRDYCDYETCVALKELGYDGYCAAYYHLFDDDEDARNSFEYAYGFDFQNSNNIYRVGAPLLYQAQKWLMEEKQMILLPAYFGRANVWICELCYRKEMLGFGGYNQSYEEALLEGIREAVKILKEKEFHNLRKAFYIDESIVWIPQGKSHKEYFDSINHSDFIETKVRGYILNDTLHLYKGSDFSIPTKKEVENIVSLFASFSIKQINLGCNIGNIGEVWKPKEIIKLLKEEK